MERTAVLSNTLLRQWLTPAMVILWFLAGQTYFRWPYAGGVLILVLVVFLPVGLRLLNRQWPHTWSTIGAIGLVMITSMAAASFFTSNLARQISLIAGSGLLFILLQGPNTTPISGVTGRLTLFAMTAAFWFGWMSLLSVSIYLQWPQWASAGLAVALTVAIGIIVWIDGGVPIWKVRRAIWLPAWLGLELWLAIWLLPTSVLVGSVVATAVVMLWLQICRHIWLHTWRPDRGKRYLTIGSAVVLVALLTARWI